MKSVSLKKVRGRVMIMSRGLFVLGIVMQVFFAIPFISLAHETSRGIDNSSSSGNNVATERQGKLGLLGDSGCLSKLSISQQDFADCLGLPDLSNLPSFCGNDTSAVVSGTNPQDGGDCLGIPNLSGLTSLCDLLGIGNNNPNSTAAGTKPQSIANCLGIPDLSNLPSLCGLLGIGNNNPNSIAAGTKRKDLVNCLGIPDLSNLPPLCGLLCHRNNPSGIAASAREASNQSSLPIAKLAGSLQFIMPRARRPCPRSAWG